MESLNKFLEIDLLSIGENKIKVYTLLAILLIYLATKLILWVIKKALFQELFFFRKDR
ncbi:MAG: hypothetical protein PF484_10730 [Bacteroidales bacterium]|jgi:hypothetical protein|nr:hypothetical protein [Bacteroidales bacterium]